MAVILRSHLYLTLQTGWSEASNTCRDHARCIRLSIVRANHQAALERTQKTPLTPVATAQFTQDVERHTLVLVEISVRLLAPVGSATATGYATVPRAGLTGIRVIAKISCLRAMRIEIDRQYACAPHHQFPLG